MKALSIRQPWAEFIVAGWKNVENRAWPACGFRGPLLIHASKTEGDEEAAAADFLMQRRGMHPSIDQAEACLNARTEPFERGGIVGIVWVTGVLRTGGLNAWFMGPLGLYLSNARRIPFIPFRGSLGLFEVPNALLPDDIRALAR